MKIGLFSENYYPYICGINPILRTLLHRLKDEGHDVHLITIGVNRLIHANKDDPQITMIKGLKMPRIIEDNLCTTVILNRKKALKQLENFHFDVIHIHGELTISKLAIEYAKKHNVPIVYTWHSLWKPILYKCAWLPGLFASFYLEHHNIKKIIRNCELYTVPSMKVYHRATKVLKTDKEPILLPSGIQEQPFLVRDEDMIDSIRYQYRLENRRVILFLGRISREKRIMTMIRYMKNMLKKDRSLAVMIVGTGVYARHIEKWAIRHRLRDSIIFTGPVLNRDTASYYQVADVFVSGSRMETQGLTYIEAMTSGTVVLAQNDPVLEGVIKDGENGFVFNEKKDFLTKLQYILDNDLKDVKANAREEGLKFSSSIYLKKLQDIYSRAIEYHKNKNGF